MTLAKKIKQKIDKASVKFFICTCKMLRWDNVEHVHLVRDVTRKYPQVGIVGRSPNPTLLSPSASV